MISLRLRAIALSAILVASGSSSVRAQATQSMAVPQTQPALARAELERRFRERTAQIVRNRLQLTEDQMAKLQASNQQFDQQRMALFAEERQARQALRAELMAGNGANQDKVGNLLDQLMRLQRRRLDLVDSEQRDLGKFMTPVQRAKYFGLQNELRKRMQELRDRAPVDRPGMSPLRNRIPRGQIH